MRSGSRNRMANGRFNIPAWRRSPVHCTPAVAVAFGMTCLIGGCNPGALSGGVGKISGEGSTFVKPIMDKWVQEYGKDHKDLEINYQGTGSGAGIKAMIDMFNEFGCTDAFMKKDDLDKAAAAGGEVVHIPLVLGAVVPAYNLPSVKEPLNFDGDVLAGIFMGKITKWKDPPSSPSTRAPTFPICPSPSSTAPTPAAPPSSSPAILTLTNDSWKTDAQRRHNHRLEDRRHRRERHSGRRRLHQQERGRHRLRRADLRPQQQGPVRRGEEQRGRVHSGQHQERDGRGRRIPGRQEDPDDLRYNLAYAPGKGSYPISGTTWAVMYVNQKGPGGREAATS